MKASTSAPTPPPVPAVLSLGKRPSQYIAQLKEEISTLKMKKTENDVRVKMLEEENKSLEEKYLRLVEAFGGGQPSIFADHPMHRIS